MTYPFYTTKATQRPSQPVALSKAHKQFQTAPENYIADEGLAGAVNVALLLEQPLLLTGEPGTGKTQLAHSLAWQLGLDEPLKFEAKSTSTASDLFYMYDAIGHFRAAQIKKTEVNTATYIKSNALGEAIIHSNPKEKVADLLPLLNFLYTEPRRSVVLIDEIDKAPRDFPNDILNEIEHNYFRIPELDNLKVEANEDLRPILVLTSNAEKYLPDAFLRRCVYYNILFPSRDNLEEIVIKRLGGLTRGDLFLASALDFFLLLRDSDLYKRPALAELLSWLSLLRSERLFKRAENPFAHKSKELEQSLSSLAKHPDDQNIAREILDDWLNEQPREAPSKKSQQEEEVQEKVWQAQPMSILTITIQQKSAENWPIVVERKLSGEPSIRNTGVLQFHPRDFNELYSLLDNPKEYGTYLGKALFQEKVHNEFKRILEDGHKVRILVEVQDKKLRELRWERLCAPTDRGWDFLVLDPHLLFSLYVPTVAADRRFQPLKGPDDLRALVVVASPEKLPPFDVANAITSVKDSLEQIPCDILANGIEEAKGAPTLEQLCIHLTEKPYSILHIVCHARLLENGETVLYWADENNHSQRISATQLLDKLSQITHLPHFAFLSTCESASATVETTFGGLGQRLVWELGLYAVVAMTERVTVKTALTLGKPFYQCLQKTGEVDLALHEAMTSLRGRDEVALPALFFTRESLAST